MSNIGWATAFMLAILEGVGSSVGTESISFFKDGNQTDDASSLKGIVPKNLYVKEITVSCKDSGFKESIDHINDTAIFSYTIKMSDNDGGSKGKIYESGPNARYNANVVKVADRVSIQWWSANGHGGMGSYLLDRVSQPGVTEYYKGYATGIDCTIPGKPQVDCPAILTDTSNFEEIKKHEIFNQPCVIRKS